MRLLLKQFATVLCLVLMTLSTFASEGAFSAGLKDRPIRIGYCHNYGTGVSDSAVEYSGFSHEYFTKAAKITNTPVTFIHCEWEDALTMLANGEIDVFGPMRKNEEALELGYPKLPFGFDHTYLVADQAAEIYYEDFDSFDNMRVGLTVHTPLHQVLEDYAKKNQFTVEIVPTESNDILPDLQANKLDLMVKGGLAYAPNTKVVAKLSSDPFYYVTRAKDYETLAWIDAGMAQIQREDVNYLSSLYEKYFKIHHKIEYALSRFELSLTADWPMLTVAVSDDSAPLQYFDKKDNSYKGIGIDLIRAAAKNCGIEVQFVSTQNLNEDTVASVDVFASYVPYFGSAHKEATVPYYTTSAMLVSDTYHSTFDSRTVGMPVAFKSASEHLLARYPSLNIAYYKTLDATLQAFKSGRLDFVFLPDTVFESLIRTYPTESYAVHHIDIELLNTLSVSNRLPAEMIGLLNKGIGMTSQGEIDALLFNNTTVMTSAASVASLIKHYSYEIALAAAVILSILVTLIFIIFRMQAKLKKTAYIDDITGGSTFLKFKLEAADILKNAEPYQYALLSIDINNFKYINSIFGYEVGNQVLRVVYNNALEYLHADTISARINADKFVFLANTHKYSAPTFISRSETLLNKRVREILGEYYNLALSIGVYTIEDPTEDLSVMLDWANIANKSSKTNFGSRLVLFTNDMKQDLKERRDITVEKERAMDNDEFIAYFQPKYDLNTGEIDGAEMLVRWQRSEDLIAPSNFIPVFEQNGFIKKLDLFMFHKACAVISDWNTTFEKACPRISVNLSPITFTSENLVENLLLFTEKYNVDCSLIEIEITESVLMHDVKKVRDIVTRLRKAGFAIAIDDFGSQYSSLNALKDLPVDVIKLDREFISHGFSDEKVCTIVSSVITMAKNLELETVAEGIETLEQVEMLRSFGCDIVQGYYYSKPIPQKQFEDLYFAHAKNR